MAESIIRNFKTGNALLDNHLDAMAAAIKTLQGGGGTGASSTPTQTVIIQQTPTTPATPTTPTTPSANQMVNTGSETFYAGHVVGFDSTGKLAKAVGPTVRGTLISIGNCSPGQVFPWTTNGEQKLYVEVGISPAKGDPAWLSAAVAGSVTNAAPAAHKQIIGQFSGTKGSDGKAFVILLPSLAVGR